MSVLVTLPSCGAQWGEGTLQRCRRCISWLKRCQGVKCSTILLALDHFGYTLVGLGGDLAGVFSCHFLCNLSHRKLGTASYASSARTARSSCPSVCKDCQLVYFPASTSPEAMIRRPLTHCVNKQQNSIVPRTRNCQLFNYWITWNCERLLKSFYLCSDCLVSFWQFVESCLSESSSSEELEV